MKSNRIGIYILAVFAMLFWSSSFIWYKIIYLYYKPFSVVILRLLISAIFLFIVGLLFKKNDKIQRVDRKYFLLLAFFEPFCYFLCESLGMQYVSATMGAIIISFIPLLTPIFSLMFLKEEISKFGISGIIISFTGVLLIVMKNDDATSSFKGIILMFLAVLSAIFYGILLKKISAKYSSITIIKTLNIIGLIYFLPLFFILEWNHFITVMPNSQAIITLLKLSIFASGLAFIFITIVIRNIGLNNTNIFANLIPVFTAFIAFFVLQEEFSLKKIIGIIIVISGLFLSQIPYFMKKFKEHK